MSEPIYLHVGAGTSRLTGFRNTDREELDITGQWPYGNDSIDGITSMHVLCEIPWRELVSAFKEMHRVLKPDGVLRFGVPHIESGRELSELLGYGNINLFSRDILMRVLRRVGFYDVQFPKFHETSSRHPLIVQADNRVDETLYVEAFKHHEGIT